MSAKFPFPPKSAATSRTSAWSLTAGLALLAVGHASAQQQESRMAELLNPDRTKTSDLAGKPFISKATVGDRKANVRAYAFSGPSLFGGTNETFRARSFADRGKFRADTFATKADRASTDTFSPAGRGFAAKAMPVEEARDANQSAPGVRRFVPGDRSTVVRGKRQDDLDDLYRQKNLSIEQVREILNKPGHGTDAPMQRVNSAPVPYAPAPRAQPVVPPTFR